MFRYYYALFASLLLTSSAPGDIDKLLETEPDSIGFWKSCVTAE